MATGAYIGIGNTAHKIKKIYFGGNNVARKVKKAYIGINGVARLWYKLSAQIKYYGTMNMTEAKEAPGATSIGEYAVFNGGVDWSSGSASYRYTMEYFTASLTHGSLNNYSTGRANMASVTLGPYILFAGGYEESGATPTNLVDQYNYSLTKGFIFNHLAERKDSLAGTTVGAYAIFGGGRPYGGSYTSSTDAYNTELTKFSPTAFKNGARSSLAAATAGNIAIFAGGTGNGTNKIDAYDSSLTYIASSSSVTLSSSCYGMAGASLGNQALFLGGSNYLVNAIDESLTLKSGAVNIYSGTHCAATVVNGYAILAGGLDYYGAGTGYYRSQIYAFDDALTCTYIGSLSTGREYLAATSIGNYAFFGGGMVRYNVDYPDGQPYSTVDIISVI